MVILHFLCALAAAFRVELGVSDLAWQSSGDIVATRNLAVSIAASIVTIAIPLRSTVLAGAALFEDRVDPRFTETRPAQWCFSPNPCLGADRFNSVTGFILSWSRF